MTAQLWRAVNLVERNGIRAFASSAAGLPAAAETGAGAAPYSYSPPGRNHLFVPGPCNIPLRVSQALMHPAENHRDVGFPYFAKQLLADSKALFKSEHGTPFIFPASGTGGWEAALTNRAADPAITTMAPGQSRLARPGGGTYTQPAVA